MYQIFDNKIFEMNDSVKYVFRYLKKNPKNHTDSYSKAKAKLHVIPILDAAKMSQCNVLGPHLQNESIKHCSEGLQQPIFKSNQFTFILFFHL